MREELLNHFYSVFLFDELEEYQETLRCLSAHIETNPTNGAALNNRALCNNEIGHVEEALADYSEAIKYSPQEYLPLKNRAMLWDKLNRFKEAIADVTQAITLAPHDITLFRVRAHSEVKCSALDAALRDFSHAIQKEPNFAYTYLERAEVYEKLGRINEAQADRDKAKELGSMKWDVAIKEIAASYDLMVFDPKAAPSNMENFAAWYWRQIDWKDEQDYNDPRVATPELQSWFLEMIKPFPAMHGPYACSDKHHPRLTDYCIGISVIYAAFSWPEAQVAFRTVFNLAKKHGVGLYNVNSEDGEVWLPGVDGNYDMFVTQKVCRQRGTAQNATKAEE